MIRPLTLLAALLAAGSGAYLFAVKHRAQVLDDQLAAVAEQSRLDGQRIRVLQAQWALEIDPTRLNQLATQFTTLQPMKPAQLVTLAALGKALPSPGAPAPGQNPMGAAPDLSGPDPYSLVIAANGLPLPPPEMPAGPDEAAAGSAAPVVAVIAPPAPMQAAPAQAAPPRARKASPPAAMPTAVEMASVAATPRPHALYHRASHPAAAIRLADARPAAPRRAAAAPSSYTVSALGQPIGAEVLPARAYVPPPAPPGPPEPARLQPIGAQLVPIRAYVPPPAPPSAGSMLGMASASLAPPQPLGDDN